MSTLSVVADPATPVPTEEPPVRWGLVAMTVVAAVLAAKSLLSDWIHLRVVVLPSRNEELHEGFGHFGGYGTAFAIGLVALVGLLGLALWLRGRGGTPLAGAGLMLSVLLLADAVLMLLEVDRVRTDAATTVTDQVRQMWERQEVPEQYGVDIAVSGLLVGVFAVLMLALVASQLLSPYRGVEIQAASGALLALVALPTPWVQSWTMVAYRLRTENVWLWSLGPEGIALAVEVLVLVLLTFITLRRPGYDRARWALATAALACLVFLSAIIAETSALQQLHDVVKASDVTVLDAKTTGMVALLATAAVLLGTAAARSFWHGREEVPPSDPADRWLPGAIRDRRD
ncbi:MAG: hypothetical protein ACRDT6_12895 [Micromonosporaceae bacterium]